MSRFTVEVVRLDGADGETLWEIDFDDNDAAKLKELQAELEELAR